MGPIQKTPTPWRQAFTPEAKLFTKESLSQLFTATRVVCIMASRRFGKSFWRLHMTSKMAMAVLLSALCGEYKRA